MAFVENFLIPLIEVIFIVGIVGFFLFYLFKGVNNAWKKSGKFTWKYKIRRKSYPESTMKWCFDAIDKGIGYYDAKKFLMVKMLPDDQVNETMWIYDQFIMELNKTKGGVKNGRKFERCDSKTQTAKGELPTI
jgi:hypothetical protein